MESTPATTLHQKIKQFVESLEADGIGHIGISIAGEAFILDPKLPTDTIIANNANFLLQEYRVKCPVSSSICLRTPKTDERPGNLTRK